MAIRVYNADDHPILRKGITDLIQEAAELEWVGSAKDGKKALKEIRSLVPDIAVLDIEMPYLTGLDVAETLLKEGLDTHFVVLTLYKEEELLNKALKMGVKGYLLKESSERDILACIHAVAEGRLYVDPSLTQYLALQKRDKGDVFANLSDHEIDILRLISRQKTSAEIADMLFISPKTVANHRSNISKKLNLAGVQNGLLKWAIEHKESLD
ncbi:MAG: DNA-binding NarL/FixJ family response regulator [Cryomorphaceae bacterium]|jgi:DNA-binding NarL/FixJ family response regulator